MFRISLTACAAAVVAFTVSASTQAIQQAGPRFMSVRDTQNMTAVGSPTISPDGQWVLHTQTVRDWEDAQLRTRTHIWRVKVDGTQRRQLTFGTANTTSPAWFPDGKRIAFLSSRAAATPAPAAGAAAAADGGNQVFIMYIDGGEAWPATRHEDGVSGFTISPDGRTLLLTAQDPLTADDRQRQRDRDDAEVVDSQFRWSHLWTHDVESGKSARLTKGDVVVSDPQWSPDSKTVAYVTRPTTKVDDAAWSDVWVTDLSGNAQKFYDNRGPDASPRWSPDGKTLAIVSSDRPGNTQWYSKLYLFPTAGGTPKVLLKDFDLDFGTPIWAPDGRIVYWSTGQGTKVALFGVDVTTGELTTTRAPMAGVNGGWDLSDDGSTWVFTHNSGTTSSDLWAARRQGDGYATPVRLTDANPWITRENLQLGATETIRWRNTEGGTIEGVLTKPVGFTSGVRYPFVVNPHGGPSGADLEGFSSFNQVLAANGFLVLRSTSAAAATTGRNTSTLIRTPGSWATTTTS